VARPGRGAHALAGEGLTWEDMGGEEVRMAGWLPVVGGAGLQFGSEDVLAPVGHGHWYHQEISERAARAAGWSPEAAGELGWNALGVDLYAYHPIWRAHGGLARLRGGRAAASALRSVHFDDLPTAREVDEIWRRITGGTITGLRWAAGRDDVGAARHLIGVALHAIQDFYSHSTWIDDEERHEHTWLETHGWPGRLTGSDDVSTGGFEHETSEHVHGRTAFTRQAFRRLPAMILDRKPRRDRPAGVRHAGRPGINLDSPWQAQLRARTRGLALNGEAAFELALGLAERETSVFLSGLVENTAFWKNVTGSGETGWTAQYDDPMRRPYAFLTAGHYPPHGTTASYDWYLRIDVPGAGGSADFVQRAGRTLQRWRLDGHRTVTLGPVPMDTPVLQLNGDLSHARVHAFRRAPQPELMVLEPRIGRSASAAEYDLAALVDRDGDRR
jgi:hypothetical protein